MKTPRMYNSNEFGLFCIDYINNNYNTFDIIKCMWQEIQELKQDLASYQEVLRGAEINELLQNTKRINKKNTN